MLALVQKAFRTRTDTETDMATNSMHALDLNIYCLNKITDRKQMTRLT